MSRLYYGFVYDAGVNTMTGGSNGLRRRVAGKLICFTNQPDRDSWIAEGYPHQVDPTKGEFRVAVTRSCLPMGWRAQHAVTVAGNSRPTEQKKVTLLRVMKLGRCASGAERDKGSVVHLMKTVDGLLNDGWGVALCGATPGRLSAGWGIPMKGEGGSDCDRCLRSYNRSRMDLLIQEATQ